MMQEPTFVFTPMLLADVDAVSVLEPLCFPSPWPASTYRHELQQNRRAFYWVLRPRNPAIAAQTPLVAYGGYWLMGEEAHIVTLASPPGWRRRHLGERLLLEMLAQARTQGATQATLEVRVGNHAAQALYQKQGFIEIGRRKRYYRDNGEDALLYTLFRLDDNRIWQPLAHRLAKLQEATTAVSI